MWKELKGNDRKKDVRKEGKMTCGRKEKDKSKMKERKK